MNGKKLAALAFVASLAATTMPSYAGAVNKTVTVEWNTQAIANMVLTTQASASQTHAASENIYQGFSGAVAGLPGCNGNVTGTAGAAGTDTSANGTINFGAVTPDSTAAVDCLEINAINAYVTTNDTNGYTVVADFTAGTPTGYDAAGGSLVCLYANGAYANNLAYAASARSAAVTTATSTTCPASGGTGYALPVNPTTVSLLTVAGASTTGTNLPADMELYIPANAPTATVTATLTYTLTPS